MNYRPQVTWVTVLPMSSNTFLGTISFENEPCPN